MQFMTFRLQLAGLITILLLCLNIEALPTKKQASNTLHKQQSLRTHSTGTAKQVRELLFVFHIVFNGGCFKPSAP